MARSASVSSWHSQGESERVVSHWLLLSHTYCNSYIPALAPSTLRQLAGLPCVQTYFCHSEVAMLNVTDKGMNF